jgi:hypothetical protein
MTSYKESNTNPNSMNFSNFASLNTYNKSTLGIPYLPQPGMDPDPHTNANSRYQVIPNFIGVDYNGTPNYNSLTLGSYVNNYPSINTGYAGGDDINKSVVYGRRPCNAPPTKSQRY